MMHTVKLKENVSNVKFEVYNKKGVLKMENVIEILATENRINTLRGRGKDNGRIVKKLQRKLRRLRESA